MHSMKTSLELSENGHSANCVRLNSDEVMSRFAECRLCLEPLQCSGPYACNWCGGVWCARCSRRLSTCVWCGDTLSAAAAPCLPLQRLINQLLLPCRNHRRGCKELLTADTRAEHEEEICEYNTMKCPFCSFSMFFDQLTAHLALMHSIIAHYSNKMKFTIEQIQTKVETSGICGTEHNIFLLHEKSIFIINVSIRNFRIRVKVMRRNLRYVSQIPSRDIYAEEETERKECKYGALIEFTGKAWCDKSAIVIENEDFGHEAEVQWYKDIITFDNEDLTIYIKIMKTDSEQFVKMKQ